jgi:chaperonin GroES
VLIGKYTGSVVKLDGEDHIILREEDVLAILDK